MGNGCSALFKVKKICVDDPTNIEVEIIKDNQDKKDQKDTKETNTFFNANNNIYNSNNILNLNQKNNQNNLTIRNDNDNNMNKSSYSANNQQLYVCNKNENKLSTNKQREEIKNSNLKSDNVQPSFTNLVQELNFSFAPNKGNQQFEIFDMNYISIKTNYNQKMMEIINKIRNDPKSIIEDLELLLKKNNKEKKILIENDETHENIIFNDVEQDINETINFLKKIKHVTNTFSINDELAIDLNLHKISEIPLEKKITKIIIDKKREIVRKHPKVQFFVNFVKDEKYGILYLLLKSGKNNNFRNVIFDDKYKEFNVTWMRDKNNLFISFLCFS